MADADRLLIVVGAATPPGRLAQAMETAVEAGTAAGAAVDILNLAETRVEICDGRPLDKYDAATQGAVGLISGAGAVLIAAPVYRASYPGVLKNLLDNAPVEALQSKPVGIVAMGGSPHHFLGVDWQLREMLTWFGALIAPTSVYLTGSDFKDGKLSSDSAKSDLAALTATLLALAKLDRTTLGPKPLAARYT
jgi:FMN reductase